MELFTSPQSLPISISHFRITAKHPSLPNCDAPPFSCNLTLHNCKYPPNSRKPHFQNSRILHRLCLFRGPSEGLNSIRFWFLNNPNSSLLNKVPFSCNHRFRNCNASNSERPHFQKLGILNKDWIFGGPKGPNSSMPDVSSMESMIGDYTEMGLFGNAISCYLEMLNLDLQVHEFSYFPCLIKAFAGISDLRNARQIHGHVLKVGIGNDIYILNALLAMYWKCGIPEDAIYMFDRMPERDSVTWSTMISGFNQTIQPEMAMKFFIGMQEFGLKPNRVACLSALSSCTCCRALILGRAVHCFIVKNGLDSDLSLVNGVIDMYMKCKDLMNAFHVFKGASMRSTNLVTWNVMISGYEYNGCSVEALILFRKMQACGIAPDSSTIVGLLESCSCLLDLGVGRQIHSLIILYRLQNDARVETALLDMYCKCGDTEAGLRVFELSSNKNFVMWGAIIAGCGQNSRPTKALELFSKFNEEGGVADSATVVSVLRVCSSLTLDLKGKEIHGFSIKKGFDTDAFVGGALTDMYAKCRDIRSAEKVLLRLPKRDVISWNALIAGYTQNDCTVKALKAFSNLQLEHIRPNTVTIACILTVCAQLSVLILCKQIHGFLIRNMFESNILVNNSLIATYARCGDIGSALSLFQKMPVKNEISWNSMISGLGMHGCTEEVFALFDEMRVKGLKPNHITFTGVISACSHTGSVDEGWRHFRSMSEDYGIAPELEQYTCMVDLLGRAGHLDQAYDLIMHMPCEPDVYIWGSLLGSCKIHGNKELAERVANKIFGLDSDIIGYHVLLSNIYEDFSKWDAVARIRAAMKDLSLHKTPGCSWIVVNNKLNIFLASDKSHYQSTEIYAALERLTGEIKAEGYAPLLPIQ